MRRALVRASAHRARPLGSGLALAVAAIPVAVVVWVAAHRLGYPYELDWLEGGAVELVGRVLHGHGLYSPPSLAYCGYTYTPFYSLLGAGVAAVTGLGFLPLRIVSLAGALLAIVMLGLYVRDATGDGVAGAMAAGLFAATDRLTGWFFDIGRLDALFLGLCLLTLWRGRRARTPAAGALVGLLAFLACFTKQVGVLTLAPALVVALLWRPRAAASALGVLGVLGLGSTLVLDAATHGWYRYYVEQELAGQPQVAENRTTFWTEDLWAHLRWPALLVGLGALSAGVEAAFAAVPRARPRPHSEARPRPRPRLRAGLSVPLAGDGGGWLYDLAALAGLLLTGWVSRVHSGGYLNVLMPAYAGAAGATGYGAAALRRRGLLPGLVATGLLALALPGLIGKVATALPTREDRAAGAQLIATLRRLPGPVLVLAHPWYATELHRGSFAQADGIKEILRSDGPRGAAELRHALTGALNREHIQAVLLDAPPAGWLAPQLRADFRRVLGDATALPLYPIDDLPTAPRLLYVRTRPVR